MNRKFIFMIAVLLLFTLATSACFPGLVGGGQDGGSQAATQNAVVMQAVQATATTMAMQTQIAQLQTQLANINKGQSQAGTRAPAKTIIAGEQATPTASPLPATATPPNTPIPPTHTAIPPTYTPAALTATATSTPIPCNAASFVADVTIADGTVVTAGGAFTKTWRLKNTGACTWTTNYDIVFVGGNQMGASAAVDMPGNVAPGQVIDLSVKFTAPKTAGHYRSNWKVRDGAGVIFGLGVTGAAFYADVKVEDTISNLPLDFIAEMCSASWSNGSTSLPCPGSNNNASGFVLRIDNPTLESGYIDDEPVLQMYPQMITDGLIRGRYPAFHVETGHHFVSTIGCAYKATACDVLFRLDYQIGSGSIRTLKTWHEVYDKKFVLVDVDLSSLAGQDVKIILTVLANGSSTQDRAQWLLPRVVKQ